MGKPTDSDRSLFREATSGALVVLLLFNAVVLARSLELLRFPGEISKVEITREGAYALAKYYSELARERGLEKNPAMRDALAKFKFEIEQALTSDDIAYAIGKYGRNVQDVLVREEENSRRELVLSIVSLDPGIGSVKDRASVVVEADLDSGVTIKDPKRVLATDTAERLTAHPDVAKLGEVVEVEVFQGKASLLTTRSLPAQIEALRGEVDRARASLLELMRTSGLAELSGPGLVIKATLRRNQADAQAFYYYDLRDIVNELFAAGALGVEVGGQRIIATSSVRAVGDAILVNQQPIPLNPIIVKAVGDPDVLASALDLLKNTPYFGLTLDAEKKSNVILASYTGRR